VRTFVAFYPDESARGELVEVAPDDAEDVRVTDMADWHVTVRFLGELDETLAAATAAATAAAAATVPPFTARLGPLTALGTAARVLFVPVRGAETLATALDDALEGIVAPRDGPYRGHLTLARARGRGRLPSTLSGMPVSLSFEVGEVALVASSLEPDRAVHQVVERFSLGEG
jgi:RNA 2',3'-cyclic 3'-phosphodiesterase